MDEFLIRLITILIPYRPLRRCVRERLVERFAKKRIEKAEMVFNDCTFLADIPNNSILLIEPNDFHGVVVPGFAKYFQDAGYNVDVLLRHGVARENPFGRFEPGEKPKIYVGSPGFMVEKLKDPKIRQYEFVFITSSYRRLYQTQTTFLKCLGYEPCGKNGVLLVEHDMGEHFYEAGEEKYRQSDRLFTLMGLHNTRMLNPHYFGKVQQRSKNKRTNFITVGNISSTTRNFDLLIGSALALLEEGEKNFTITVVGSGKLNVDDRVKPYFRMRGRLDFPELYEEMECSDYILGLLDSNNEAHKRYLGFVITGSVPLSLGFAKPMILERAFADEYKFSDNNTIVYDRDGLPKAMKKAIQTTPTEYDVMVDNLLQLRDKIHKKSQRELIEATKSIREESSRISRIRY